MKFSELSDEQLVKAFKETVLDCQHKNSYWNWLHDYDPMAAELLRRLGAAVSAPPQPDFKGAVTSILANCAARYANPRLVYALDPQSVIDKQIDNGVEILKKFFAAAPSQPYSRPECHLAACESPEECKRKGICKFHYREAQEQPVENSTSKDWLRNRENLDRRKERPCEYGCSGGQVDTRCKIHLPKVLDGYFGTLPGIPPALAIPASTAIGRFVADTLSLWEEAAKLPDMCNVQFEVAAEILRNTYSMTELAAPGSTGISALQRWRNRPQETTAPGSVPQAETPKEKP